MILSKPINSSIKLKVKTIFKSSKRRADKVFSENIATRKKGLDNFESLKILDNEYQIVKKKIKKSKYPFYIENSNSPEWVITQFASRTYLLNIDESIELEECIFLGKYKDNLYKAIEKIRKDIPLYTFEKFINGEICNYFLTFKNYRNLSEEDFYKIVKWQSENIINIISYESKVLIRLTQDYCKNLENPLSFIESQNNILDELFQNRSNDANQLKEILSRLIFLKDFDFTKFDNDLLLKHFNHFTNEEFHWHSSDYNKIKPIADFLRLKPTYFFSDETFVFESINKVGIWFEEILKGKSIQEEYKYFDYKKELERVQSEAKEEIDNIYNQIEAYIYDEKNSEKEVKTYFLKLYESNRMRFNRIKHKDIMHMLNEDKKHLLINYFTTNAFFGNNVKKVSDNLKEVIIVQEVAWDIFVTHNEFFKTKTVYDFIDSGVYEIIGLLNQMVLNKKLYKATRKAQLAFFSNFQRFSLPFDYHFIDIQTEMRNVFSIALKNLQEFLDDAEPTNKIIYLQSRIKEIKQREIVFKQYEDEYDSPQKGEKYYNLFKEFLLIEADFIKETVSIPKIQLLDNPAPKLITTSTENFETIINEVNQLYILKMLEDLSITNNGKSILSERRKGAIRGIVESLKENSILPNINLDKLCKLIAMKIQLELNSKLDFSTTSNEYYKKANEYIKSNPLH